MKKSLKLVLIILAVIGALVVGLLVFLGLTAGKNMSESIPIVKSVSVDIVTNVIATQKYSEFSKYSDIALQSQLSKEDVGKIFEMYKTLGKFVSSEDPVVSSIVAMSGGKGKATVKTKAVFEKGPAQIELIFIKNNNNSQWQLDSFYIDSDVLLKMIQ